MIVEFVQDGEISFADITVLRLNRFTIICIDPRLARSQGQGREDVRRGEDWLGPQGPDASLCELFLMSLCSLGTLAALCELDSSAAFGRIRLIERAGGRRQPNPFFVGQQIERGPVARQAFEQLGKVVEPRTCDRRRRFGFGHGGQTLPDVALRWVT